MILDDDLRGTCTATEAAALLGVDERTVQNLAASGHIDRIERGRYRSISVVHGYIRYLREERKSQTKTASESRLQDVRAAEIQQRTALRNHDLIEREEAEAVIAGICGMLKTELDGLGARVTRDVPMKKKIEGAVDDVFRRTAERIGKEVESLRASGAALDTDATGES